MRDLQIESEIRAATARAASLQEEATAAAHHAAQAAYAYERCDYIRADQLAHSGMLHGAPGRVDRCPSCVSDSDKLPILLNAERECADAVYIGDFETLDAAAARVESLEALGEWPEGYDAVARTPEYARFLVDEEWHDVG